MKNKNKFIWLSLAITLIALPCNVFAKTVKDLENEVNKYVAQLQEKQSKIAKNDAEVAEIKKKIADIEAQITAAEDEMDRLEKEIEESNKKIADKKEQSKKIMKYFQVINSGNTYLEYIFEANSVTDMIYRISVVEQLTDYNQQVVKELNQLIAENKTKKEELQKKNEEIKALKESLQSEKERINADTATIRDSMPSIEEQIKAEKANLAYYKKLGCGSNEDINACYIRTRKASGGGSIPSTGSALRPTMVGTNLGGLGYYAGHTGHDIGSPNKKDETIYPIASGIVRKVYRDNCLSFCQFKCNGNANIIVMEHNINGRTYYASYVHLDKVFVSESNNVISAYTPIGKMGNTGCTSGHDEGGTKIHLHLEMATCNYMIAGGGYCKYKNYKKTIIEPGNLISFPGSWNNR